ncbi:WbqC-like protein family protein [Catalinimonas alkaloidigena]|uniref:WbqC-like protein family protein n=2 Tax=Catalinimonas alkaloidigena TaxID=1075417 RepID=A0A1G9AL08_9BACT|nr:WbqC-like protein family protein [Catalinimonas alkaloidigena]
MLPSDMTPPALPPPPGPLLTELHYFPCQAFFAALLRAEGELIIEAHETFQKQTYRNRCYIQGANQVLLLTVPVEKARKHVSIKDVRIDTTQRWRAQHWRAVQSAYGKSPFFEFFADEFERVFAKEWEWLYELNRFVLTQCLNLLGLSARITETEHWHADAKGVWDLRSAFQPGQTSSWRHFYQPVVYPQLFGEEFAENLSVLDLLCCEGPHALSLLKQSIRYRN